MPNKLERTYNNYISPTEQEVYHESMEVVSNLTTPQYLIPETMQIYDYKANNQTGLSYTQIISNASVWNLPIPMQLDYNSDYDWSDEATSWTADALENLVHGEFGESFMSALKAGGTTVKNFLQGATGASDTTANALARSMGKAYNPNKTLFFNEVRMREFTLNFVLAPFSADEARAIKKGFKEMARSAAPGYEYSKFFFTYPNKFTVYVQVNGVALLKRTELAITSLNLGMTDDGQLTWHSDGFPTNLSLSITFKESVVPTKDNLANITLFGQSL